MSGRKKEGNEGMENRGKTREKQRKNDSSVQYTCLFN
jgi:hypothetical protein